MRFGLQIHALFLLVFVAVRVSCCGQEDYWKMKLPNVPMPPAIKDNLFHSHGIESSTIDSKETKVSLNQLYTVFNWHHETDSAEDKAKVEDIKSSTIDTKEKKASLNQPYTVFNWHYDADNVKHKEKVEDIESFTINTKEKKASLNQPYTVFNWHYNADNAKDKTKVEDIKTSTIDTKEKKDNLNQPVTVFDWLYNAKDKSKVEDLKTFTIDTEEKKDSLNQPVTVFDWLYNAYNAKDTAKVEEIESSKIDTKEKKASLNQPYTVFSCHYDANNAKDKERVEDIVSSTMDTKEKKASLNQLYTVFNWHYDADNAKGKARVEDIESSTIDSKEKKPSLKQSYTVFNWRYDPYNAEDKADVQYIEPSSTKPKEKSVHWNYKVDNAEKNAKEECSKKISPQHHHVMHKDVNLDDRQQDLNGESVFFVEKTLRLGMTLKHDFQKTPKVPLLPRHFAQSIPFSDDRITEILDLFSIKSDSKEATAIKETLGVCLHRPKVKKENRTCAQSIEGIVDFVVGELGTNDVQLRMMRNDIEVMNGIKDYVITKVNKLVVPGNNAVACHKMSYPYVVYYCHHQQDIGHYDVTLVSPTLGSSIQTTAVCHYDTYAWQADVPALRDLGIRPGDAPVCHFSAINDMFWTIKDISKSLDMAQ